VELITNGVKFSDGTEEIIDVIVYATGYKISFPFIEQRFLNWQNGRPELFLNVFHPTFDNLFVAGLIQPDSGLWGLVDYQSQLISRFLLAQQQNRESAEKFRRLKSQAGVDLSAGIHYVNSSRHLLEVEHYTYRRRLQKLIAAFGA
jgi:hypothetical protein